jgi:hypothetical protein
MLPTPCILTLFDSGFLLYAPCPMPYAANGVSLKRFFENRRTTLQFCLSLLLPFNQVYYHYFQVK